MSQKARRRKKRVKKPYIDHGTPETRAKQYIPFWRSLEPELQEAAMAIYEAIYLEMGEVLCDSSRLEHLPRSASSGWSRAQLKIIRQYRRWQEEMARHQYDHKPVIRHCFFDEPCRDEEGFIRALVLYCEMTGTIKKIA